MKIYEDLAPGQKNFVKKSTLFSVVFINALILSLFIFYGASAYKELGDIGSRKKIQISVQGEGRVFAKPDIAKITATVLSDKVALADAQKENTDISSKVADALKKNNIAEKDIQTLSYNIYPQYFYPVPCYPPSPCPAETQSPKIIGYQVRNTFQIIVRDIAKAGDVLDGIVKAGANEVSSFQLTIDDPKNFQAEARKKAIEDAQKKAEAAASNLGKKLARMTGYSESGVSSQNVPLGFGGGDAKSIAVLPGENEVVSAVVITYELK